jgi:hypothetical protein
MCPECVSSTALFLAASPPVEARRDWVCHHDHYDAKGHVDATGAFIAEKLSQAQCFLSHLTLSPVNPLL